MTKFKLRSTLNKVQAVRQWAEAYEVSEAEEHIQQVIVPKVRAAGFMDKQSFLRVCEWKTPRSKNHCAANKPGFIQEITQFALSTSSERMRIEVLTLLQGVSWPTASVILHWFHKDPYPILDFRALWSLQSKVPSRYEFDFWSEYTSHCRTLADRHGMDMRTLDRALWQYSSENQG